MALFHLSVTQTKRSAGQSAIASAAYRAGERLYSEYYGEYSDYTRKGGVICSDILLPSHAPKEYADRQTLWNAVEKAERGKTAQLAYSFDIALQNEFSLEENIALARQFLLEQFVSRGMVVDFAVHQPDREDGGIPNPHFHVLCPIRPIEQNGKWGCKQHRVYELDEDGNRIRDADGNFVFNAVPTTDWGSPETLEYWRQTWAELCNAKFAEKGLDVSIDHRSYERQGVELLPTVHEGATVRAMEKKGIRTEKGEFNRWIKATNAVIRDIKKKIALLFDWIAEAKAELPVAGHRQAVCRRRAAGAGAWLRRVSTVSLLGWWAGMRKKEPLLPVLILGLLAFTVLWPLWFTVDGALMASDELTAALGPALLDTADGGYAVWTILPSWPTLQPLAELLLDTPQFFSVFWNTCLLAFAQIAGQLVVAAPASWAFAKLRFAGRRFLLLGYIALMVLPFQVLMVPNYLIATRLGIYDTPLSVILPGVFSAFPVFIMTRSFQDVPNELLEAAKLDGATAWQIFWKIGVPLGYAGIFAALVLNFIEGWNAVEQPLLFLKSQSNWPLSMYMNDIVTDNLGIAMAASLLSLIPAMLVFLYGQTYLELGIQAGGIKA